MTNPDLIHIAKIAFVKRLAIILALLSYTITGFTQQPKFDHLTVKQGLSLGNVLEIHQGKFGFIWIGTEDGLNMYDGYSFTIYRNNPSDSFSISNNNVRCIAEDADANFWIGTQDGLNFYNRKLNRFERFFHDETRPGSISSNDVWSILIDSQKNLLVGTSRGLNIFDYKTKTFTQLPDNHHDLRLENLNFVRDILEDSDHRIWLATYGGLRLLNKDRNSFTDFFHDPNNPLSLSSNNVTALCKDNNGTLWIGTVDGGLNKMLKDNTFEHFAYDKKDPKSLANNYVYDIAEDKSGNLWIATDGALNKMNQQDGRFVRYAQKLGNDYSLNASTITKIFFDDVNRMWIGTRFGGVNIFDNGKYAFEHFTYNHYDSSTLSHNNVTSFEEDNSGNFWIGTDGGSLNHYDRQRKKFTSYLNTFSGNKVLAVEKDRHGKLWVGMWQEGLNYFDPQTKKIKRYQHDPKNANSISDNNIFYILEDSKQNIWVATWGNGLNRYNPATDDFTRFIHNPTDPNSFCGSPIQYLMEDQEGKIWIATSQEGLDIFDPATSTFTHYKAGPAKGSLSSNSIYSLYSDIKKRIWVGTNGGGLNLFDPATKTFKVFREQDGLPNNAIMCMEEDAKGRLWLSTNKGLSCFDYENLTFKNYTENQGLQGDQFNRWAVCRLSTGELLFGGVNGFNLFNPENIKDNTLKPAVYITGFKIFNKSVAIGDDQPLKKNILLTDVIELSYRQNEFSLEFTALNYRNPEGNQYRYKLEGFQNEWIDAGTERKVSYTNLSPGEYTFRVIASNNDGLWNEEGAALKIIITPVYWQTWWFKTALLLLCLATIAALITSRINNVEKQKKKLEELIREQTAEVMGQKEVLVGQAENMQALNEQLQAQTDFLQNMNGELEREREQAEKARHEAERANQAKSVFLATMSHEIRTPMNGMLGMAILLAETPLTDEQREYTDTIRSSGDSLLTVINDILDFSKIESGNLEIDNHNFELRHCVEEVMDLFSPKAAQKNLDLVYDINPQIPPHVIGDSHRLRQVLINLIGNAFKFTEKGEIYIGIDLLNLEQSSLDLAFQVRDTGIGIAADKASRLFKAFSQVDSSTTRKYGGTGLGLVICQRLVELMGGSIKAESQPDVGTTFTFTIKMSVNLEAVTPQLPDNIDAHAGKKVLVVDDNDTNLTIVKKQLERWKLTPVVACSAHEAMYVMQHSEKFDLVITDLQMPQMDGVLLTQFIKSKYSSVPVILLSSIGEESKNKYPDLFTSILTKPVKQQQLFREIQMALNTANVAPATKEVVEQKQGQLLSKEFASKYPLRILLTDDNPVNQKLALGILKKLGYLQIDTAQNGLEAVQKSEQQYYDVILMDVQMPVMDGLEATRVIRSNHDRHQPIIISMTANAMPEDREACLGAGMDDYVAKPIKIDIMIAALQKAAQRLATNAA